MRIFITSIIFICLASVATAGLDQAGKYNEVIAIYKFEDTSDSGPRELHGRFFGDASIVRNGRGRVLKLANDADFNATSADFLSLNPDFTVAAWIGLKSCCLTIAMMGYDDDDTAEFGQRTVGYAGMNVLDDGNITGWFDEVAGERTLGKSVSLQSTDVDVTNFRWRHIAFSRFGDIYTLFVDGKVVDRRYIDEYVSFWAENTHIYIITYDLKGNAYVDDAIFLEIGLSVYEIKAIMNSGLDAFLEAMPVDPADKVATTWAAVKSR